jgi:hypothetical protein
MCISKQINWITSEVQVSDFFSSFFSLQNSFQQPWEVICLSFSFSNNVVNVVKLAYLQKDRNGKRLQWKKAMGLKTTVYSKSA